MALGQWLAWGYPVDAASQGMPCQEAMARGHPGRKRCLAMFTLTLIDRRSRRCEPGVSGQNPTARSARACHCGNEQTP